MSSAAQKMKVEVKEMKKISSKKLEKAVNVAETGLSMAIIVVGYLTSHYIVCRIWPTEVAYFAKWICCLCGCGLGMLAIALAMSKRAKRTKEFLTELGVILALVTVYGVVAARMGVDASSMITSLTLQLIVGAVVMIAMIGCDEGANRIRRKLFGNMAKIGDVWCTFDELHY